MKKMITSCKTVILSSLIAVQAMAQQPAADSTSYLDNKQIGCQARNYIGPAVKGDCICIVVGMADVLGICNRYVFMGYGMGVF